MMSKSVILLDAASIIIRGIGVERAIGFIATGKGESVLDSDMELHARGRTIPVPLAIQLNYSLAKQYKYVFAPVGWSRHSVKQRDGFTCAYCSRYANTIDHIIPQSRGGKNTWENTVACCFKCNSAKGDRALQDTNMKLSFEPYAPKRADLISLNELQREFVETLGFELHPKPLRNALVR